MILDDLENVDQRVNTNQNHNHNLARQSYSYSNSNQNRHVDDQVETQEKVTVTQNLASTSGRSRPVRENFDGQQEEYFDHKNTQSQHQYNTQSNQ